MDPENGTHIGAVVFKVHLFVFSDISLVQPEIHGPRPRLGWSQSKKKGLRANPRDMLLKAKAGGSIHRWQLRQPQVKRPRFGTYMAYNG